MTQEALIHKYLKKHGSITQLVAWSEFNVWRLASRVNALRKRGVSITTKMQTAENGSRYALYTLNSENEGSQTYGPHTENLHKSLSTQGALPRLRQ